MTKPLFQIILPVVVDVLILGAIITQAVIYYDQVDEMRIDRRAWMATSSITGIPQEKELFRPRVSVTNTGRTFAKNIQIHSAGDFVAPGHLPDFYSRLKEVAEEHSANGASRVLMSPNGQTFTTLEAKEENRQTSDSIEGLKKGTIKFFIYGQILYDDIFNHPHWLIFCDTLEYNPREPENGGWFYAVYKKYNDTGDGQPPSWKQ
jgi:hypothetical protein